MQKQSFFPQQLGALQFGSAVKYSAFLPTGCHRFGSMPFVMGYNPNARMPSAAATCNGPVAFATNPSAALINCSNSLKLHLPAALVMLGQCGIILFKMTSLSFGEPVTMTFTRSHGNC